MANNNNPLTVEVVDGQLVISIGLDTLKMVQEYSPSGQDGAIVDMDEFVKDLILAMTDEDEAGNTLVTTMFDDAIADAMDTGSEGIQYV